MKTKMMWIGICDGMKFPWRPSLSSNVTECKKKIYYWYYDPLKNYINWLDWKFTQIEVMVNSTNWL